MPVPREMKESPLLQGEDEQIAYRITTTPWGSSPTSVDVKCYDITTGARTDVTSTKLTGTVSVTGDAITCPVLKSLIAGNTYRVEVKFTAAGNVLEAYFIVRAEY